MDLAPLAQVALFQGLNQSQLRKVAAICEEQKVAAGALIFREGEAAQSMYLLVQGKVRISRRVPGMGEEALAILDSGQYFGEMGVVEESVRSADAYAHQASTLWRIDRRKIRPAPLHGQGAGLRRPLDAGADALRAAAGDE